MLKQILRTHRGSHCIQPACVRDCSAVCNSAQTCVCVVSVAILTSSLLLVIMPAVLSKPENVCFYIRTSSRSNARDDKHSYKRQFDSTTSWCKNNNKRFSKALCSSTPASRIWHGAAPGPLREPTRCTTTTPLLTYITIQHNMNIKNFRQHGEACRYKLLASLISQPCRPAEWARRRH